MKPIIDIINQVSVLEDKIGNTEEYERCFNRIKQSLLELGYNYSWPLNESYRDTCTDIDATIIGETNGHLTITKVIKPIITKDSQILQRGVVVVEAK